MPGFFPCQSSFAQLSTSFFLQYLPALDSQKLLEVARNGPSYKYHSESKIQEITGKGVDDTGGSDEGEDMRFAFRAANFVGTKPLSVSALKRSRPLLSREFDPQDASLSKSGNKIHAVLNTKTATSKMNDLIHKASRALKDPEHRLQVRKKVQAKLGAKADLGIIGNVRGK